MIVRSSVRRGISLRTPCLRVRPTGRHHQVHAPGLHKPDNSIRCPSERVQPVELGDHQLIPAPVG
jgi:hypothetical protein